MRSQSNPQFRRIAAVFNPISTNQGGSRDELRSLEIPVTYVPTHPDVNDTRKELFASLEPGMVVLGLGGDGTANQLGNAMLHQDAVLLGVDDVPFVPLRYGKANDIARSYNGLASVAGILRYGMLTDMYPLDVHIQELSGRKTARYALGYFSVGSAAEAAGTIEDTKSDNWLMQHGPQQIRDISNTLQTVAHAPTFKYRLDGGDELECGDMSFVRIDRMARYGRLHAHPARNAYELIITPATGYAGTAATMIRLATGRLIGTMLKRTASLEVLPGRGRKVPIQIDGESRSLDGRKTEVVHGTTISVRPAAKSFKTLLTR